MSLIASLVFRTAWYIISLIQNAKMILTEHQLPFFISLFNKHNIIWGKTPNILNHTVVNNAKQPAAQIFSQQPNKSLNGKLTCN